MFDNFDTYTIRARLAPSLVVVLPIGMAIGVWLPTSHEYLGLLSTGAAALALLALLSQLARRPGKLMEAELFSKWGGMPSVQMLSFKNSQITAATLRRYHDRLNVLIPRIDLPLTAEDEARDQGGAFEKYRTASDWLVNSTRNKDDFRLVCSENINYGYCRNLLGLKPFGLATWSVGVIACSIRSLSPLLGPPFPTELSWLAIVYTLICVVILIVIAVIVRQSWVRFVADEYSKQLIAAIDKL